MASVLCPMQAREGSSGPGASGELGFQGKGPEHMSLLLLCCAWKQGWARTEWALGEPWGPGRCLCLFRGQFLGHWPGLFARYYLWGQLLGLEGPNPGFCVSRAEQGVLASHPPARGPSTRGPLCCWQSCCRVTTGRLGSRQPWPALSESGWGALPALPISALQPFS